MTGRWRAAPALAAVALLLPACMGGLFKSKEAARSVYLLNVTAASSGGPEIAADITVLRPRVRPGLDSESIAALYPDRRLEHFAGARWGGPLDKVVQSLALQAFRVDARVHDVHTDDSALGSGYWLEIEVIDFQAEYAAPESSVAAPPTVHVRLVARLGASGDHHVLTQLDADVRARAADNRLAAIVDAYERAANAALLKIVAATGKALRADNATIAQ